MTTTQDVTQAITKPNSFEACIRFNGDNEKDYAFILDTDTTFNDLYKIFDILPISLRPSIFYNQKPKGFAYSTNPGFLTSTGALLLPYNSDNDLFVKTPKSQLDKISDYIWPTQLILPQWEFNHFNHLNVLLLLLAWLYTDLPDFISPTPGICATNQLLKLAALAVTLFTGNDNSPVAQNLLYETRLNGTSKVGQGFFFFFHVLKVLIVYGSLYTGLINPVESNPFAIIVSRGVFFYNYVLMGREPTTQEKYKDLNPQDLISIGWTGARRQTIDDFRDHRRQAIIDENGGVVKTHQKGILLDINKNMGVYLDNDEGFGTPLPSDHATKKNEYPLSINSVNDYPEVLKETLALIKQNETETEDAVTDESLFTNNPEKKKFTLSYEYFAFYNINFLTKNKLLTNEDFTSKLYKFNSNELVRNFRKFGSYANGGAAWNKYYQARLKLGNYGKGERFADPYSIKKPN